MRLLSRAGRRIRMLLSGRRFDRDLQDEMQLHLELRERRLRETGLSPDEARAAARRRFGNIRRLRDESTDAWGWRRIDDLRLDLRDGVRALRRTPAFTLVALATLALGIGANVAVFTLVNGVVLRPLGYPAPEQVVVLTSRFGFGEFGLAPPEYAELTQLQTSFAHVGAFTTGEANLSAGDRPRRVRAVSVDAAALAVLGLAPAEGRLLSRDETAGGGALPPPVAMLSYEFWRTAFSAGPMVGRSVLVDGRAHEIVGIMPPGADLMDHRTEIWLPLSVDTARRQDRGAHFLSIVARLAAGTSLPAAHSELTANLGNWRDRFPSAAGADHVPTRAPTGNQHSIEMRPLQTVILGNADRTLWVLQAAVGVVLLIVCANLASLAVARAESRRRELAVRAALGASRLRLLRQTVTEGALLALAGGLIGLWSGRTAALAVVRAYPTSLPRTSEITVDSSVVAIAALLSAGVALFFGLVAAARTGSLAAAVRDNGRTVASGGRRLRAVLVVIEIALAVVVAVGAGLLVRTVVNLARVDPGFDPARLVTFSITLPPPASTPAQRARSYRTILDRLRTLPGVQATTAMSGLPPDRELVGLGVCFEHGTASTGKPFALVDHYQLAMSDYFETMRIPIVKGRAFTAADGAAPERVAIVNETFASTIWQGRDPIGQRLRPCAAGNPWHRVIGVARDVKQRGVARAAGTEFYLSVDQRAVAPPTMHVVLRTGLPLASIARAIEQAVADVQPGVPIVRLRDMDAVLAESIRRPTLMAQVLAAFAALALLLAAIGAYGVLAYAVAERRREIGIRLVLGAARADVLRQTMGQGLRLAALGLAIGLAGAGVATRGVESLLFGVPAVDAPTFAGVAVAIVAITALACVIPALRASRVDPNVVLRAE